MTTREAPAEVKRLVGFLERKEPVDLNNLFVLLQLIVGAMATRYRWDKRARAHLSKKSKAKGRQLYRENILEHCFKTGMLAALMAEVEQRGGTTDLHSGRLILAGLLHDIPELFRGDKFYWGKTDAQAKAEQGGFELLSEHFSPELREFLRDVYSITQPDYSDLSSWTKEQRFFKLIELVGYFKRTLAECRAGNLNFAPVLLFHWKKGDVHDPLMYEKEFPATLAFWFPDAIRSEIERFASQATGGVST